jgi:hypothetical protein
MFDVHFNPVVFIPPVQYDFYNREEEVAVNIHVLSHTDGSQRD